MILVQNDVKITVGNTGGTSKQMILAQIDVKATARRSSDTSK